MSALRRCAFSHVGLCFVQNVRLVRVNYWVEKAETGIHIDGNVLHTDNQIRRARCWFPCVDDISQRCWYERLLYNLVSDMGCLVCNPGALIVAFMFLKQL